MVSIPLLPFDLRSVALSGTFNLQVDTTGLMGAIVFPVTPMLEVRVEDQIVRTLPGLRVRVDAEGVETEGQMRMLEDHGCRSAQGYLFAKAMPNEEFLRYLEADQPATSRSA